MKIKISKETEKLLFTVVLKIINEKMYNHGTIDKKQKDEIDRKIEG